MINWRSIESELPIELVKVLWRYEDKIISGHYSLHKEDLFRDHDYEPIGDNWGEPPTHWCYLSEII